MGLALVLGTRETLAPGPDLLRLLHDEEVTGRSGATLGAVAVHSDPRNDGAVLQVGGLMWLAGAVDEVYMLTRSTAPVRFT